MMNESSGDPSSTIPAPRRSMVGRLKWPLIVIIAIAALYLVSPYYSFWRFTQALKAGDQQQFEKMVDFRSVRESLKKQLRAKLAETRAREPKPAAEQAEAEQAEAEQPKTEQPLLALSAQFAPRLID
ncbi:MAG TPA: DUF2939 domain-containing protein, partial [Chthoniobacterales bacterium]|nr:DUF2939 domain-containing protein [Chthoniobacterales bacterium]